MSKKSKITLIVLSIVLIALIIIVKSKDFLMIDTKFYNFISSFITNNMTTIFKTITALGSAKFLIGLSIILILIIKNSKISLYILLNLLLSSTLNSILKKIVIRPRPLEINLIKEKGYSFPSGHTMTSVAFYGFLIYLIYKYIKNKYLKYSLISLLTIVSLLIGLSRIYLGVHYLSDVIGGIIFGLIYLIIFISIVNKDLSKL